MSVRLEVYPFKRRDVIALMFNHCLGSNNCTACVLERGTQLTLTRGTTKLVLDIRPAAKMTQNSAQTGGGGEDTSHCSIASGAPSPSAHSPQTASHCA